MQMLKKLFNSDKKYYLELDESAEAAKPEVTKAPAKTAKAEAPAQKTAPVKAATAEAGKAKSAPAKKAATPVKAKKNSKGKAGKTAKASQNGKVATAPKNAGASSYDPPFWVAAMYSKNSASDNGSGSQASGQNFATEQLLPTVTNYRRRPGGSLEQFRKMARTAKTPRG